MLKEKATWQEIQDAWNTLTYEEQGTVAKGFDKGLKQHNPETHARLIALFKNEGN
jgi:hypothetical protein|tara:strand:+ start:557 stop:721 length:165 start_codon:yes stop_codon:yes gene_type:complete